MPRLKKIYEMHLTERESFSDYLPWRFWDSENRCYMNMDDTFGWFWELEPLAFAGEHTMRNLDLILTSALPSGTSIQFILFADPRIRYILEKLIEKEKTAPRIEKSLKDVTGEWIRRYTDHMDKHTQHGFDESVPVPIRNFRMFCAVKVPYKDYEQDVKNLADKRTTIDSMLRTSGFHPVNGEPACLLDLARYLLNPKEAYKDQNYQPYNSYIQINKQAVNASNEITWVKGFSGGITIDEHTLGVYTVKSFPDEPRYTESIFLLGDIFKQDLDQIACPFIITLTFLNKDYAPEIKKKASLILTQKAIGAGKTRLEKKKADFQRALNDISEQVRFNGVLLSIVTYCKSPSEKAKVEGVLNTIWKNQNYVLQEETFMAAPIFISTLPFGLFNNKKTQENLKRIEIAPTRTIAQLVPCQAEWKGVLYDPTFLLTSRRGQLIGMDLFKSNSNYNFAIAALSGAGKSVFAAYVVISQLRLGDIVWIIDVGRSYLKLCRLLGGEFLEFNSESKICINPFSLIKDIMEDMPMVLPMLEKMAKPKSGCDDYETNALREAIQRTWQKYNVESTPSKVGEILMEEKSDKKKHNLGSSLQNYGPMGEYGRWFEGKATFDQSATFRVLELDGLNNDPHLRSLVLMFVIYQLVQLMFISRRQEGPGKRGRRLVALFDEAWELFNDESSGIAKFILAAYKKARKYGGAIGTITQRVSEYYQNEATKNMLSNAAHWYFLEQKEEDLVNLKKDDQINLTPFLLKYITSVHTIRGKYSEIFIKSGDTVGIGRLFLDPFTYAMLTTEPTERDFIDGLLESGYEIKEALIEAAESNFGRKVR